MSSWAWAALTALWTASLLYPFHQLQAYRLILWGWSIPLYYLLAAAPVLLASCEALRRAPPRRAAGWLWWALAAACIPGLLASGDGVWSTRQWASFLLRGLVPGWTLWALAALGDGVAQRVMRVVYPAAVLAALFGLFELSFDRNPLVDRFAHAAIPATHEPANPFYRPALDPATSMRPMGTQGNRIPYAACLVAFLPYALWRAKYSRRRLLPPLGALVLFATIVFSQTRSAWFGALVGLTASALLFRDRPRALLTGGAASAVVLGAACWSSAFRAMAVSRVLHASQDPDVLRRLASLETLRMLKGALWLTGVGFGRYPELYEPFYHGPLPSVPTPDNQYLRWLLENGLLGSAALLGLLAVVLWVGWLKIRMTRDRREADLYLSLLAGWAGIAATFAFFDGFYWGACCMTFWCLLGLFAACPSGSESPVGR